MSRTLNEDIAADAAAVILAGDGLGFDVAITHRVRGDASNTATIQAIVDRDNEQPFMAGNHLTNADRHGERVNANVYLTILSSVTVSNGDVFVLADGTIVNYVETLSRDDSGGLQRLACVAPNGISTKNPRLRP